MQNIISNSTYVKLALIICILSAKQSISRAEIATFYITTDTTLDYKSQSSNYGTSSGLDLYLNDYTANSTDVSATKPTRALLSFIDDSKNSIVSLPTDTVITSVTLNLYCYNCWNRDSAVLSQSPKIVAYALTSSFSESKATWLTTDGSTSWTAAGGDYDKSVYAESGTITGASWTTIDLTSIWDNANVQNNGIIITFDPEDTSIFTNAAGISAFIKRFFYSSDSSGTTYDPHITITYEHVPEPSTIAMLITVGIAIGMVIKHRKSR
jgi:hypothetical protein